MNQVTVVIPTLNEAEWLGGCLESVRAEFDGQVIVTDGGSDDGTRDVAEPHEVEWVAGSPGLAVQCNRGVTEAKGQSLFFLSADCRPARGWWKVLKEAIADPTVAAGGFRLTYSGGDWRMALIAFGGNFRARYVGMSLPDQGLFTPRRTFDGLKGFCPQSRIPFARYCLQAAKVGPIRLLPHPMLASARDFEEKGRWNTVKAHAIAYWKFRRELANEVLLR